MEEEKSGGFHTVLVWIFLAKTFLFSLGKATATGHFQKRRVA